MPDHPSMTEKRKWPWIYVHFHWRIFHTGFQRDPVSLAIAGWPLGTLEISFPYWWLT